jgi:hypothetical protein
MSFARMIQMKNAFEDWRKAMLRPESKLRALLQKEIYPMYQNMQLERWRTEGASEESRFPRNSIGWENYKKEMKQAHPDQYPGGDKSLTFTGKLASSVIGNLGSNMIGGSEGVKFHRKTITATTLFVTTTIPYAMKAVDWLEAGGSKNFMTFSKKSTDRMKNRIHDFMKREAFTK